MRSLLSSFCLLILPLSMSAEMHSADDINSLLRNNSRSDVSAEFLWNRNDFGKPSLGLNGEVAIVHTTDIKDLAVVKVCEIIDGEKKELVFQPMRNEWSPAGMKTRYRNVPLKGGKDLRSKGRDVLGLTVLKEQKAVVDKSVFISEIELRNSSPIVKEYEVRIDTPQNLDAQKGSLSFKYIIMLKRYATEIPAALLADKAFESGRIKLPPNKSVKLRYSLALGGDAKNRAKSAFENTHIFADNAAEFNAYFAKNVPQLAIANLDMLRMYYYRHYVLKRARHDARRIIPDHPYPRPALHESPAGYWYSCAIGLPVGLQILEASWLRDGEVAWAHLKNWSDSVLGYRGYIQMTPACAWELVKRHPNIQNTKEVAESLADFSLQTLPKKGTLPIQYGSWGVGAEYQPNFYQFTEPKWDFRNDVELRKLDKKYGLTAIMRLDTASFAMFSLRGTAKILALLGDSEKSREFNAKADSLAKALAENNWSESKGLFLAADAKTGRLADESACYDSFVPYMFGDFADAKYLAAFEKLFDNDWFGDDFGATTAARNCEMFFSGSYIASGADISIADAHYYTCCWNGPVWNFANSLISQSLGAAAERKSSLRCKWVDFFSNWSAGHFVGGDTALPMATEHYRSDDGVHLSKIPDYFHSAWIDPFMKYWCGIRIGDDLQSVVFDPYYAGDFELVGVPVAGREMAFKKCGEVLTVKSADGKIMASGKSPLKVEIASRRFLELP